MAWVYILHCSDDSYYVGSTRNLNLRLEQHSAGQVDGHTARHLPVELIWSHEYPLVTEAYEMERKIHGWSRAKKEALIAGRFDLLPGLSVRGGPASVG